jgi:uncharacterized hydantoinase/oxoprolinase family protein
MAIKAGATPEVQFSLANLDLSFIAGEALTGHQYKPVYLSAERTVKLMTENDGTQHFVGFLQSGDIDSTVTVASGDFVSVRIRGFTYAVGQVATAMGLRLMVADSQGRLAAATTGLITIAETYEAFSAINHIATVKIVEGNAKHS